MADDIEHIKAILKPRNYEIGDILGVGGFARAFIVTDHKKNRKVACKIVDRAKVREKYKIEDMATEPETASRFLHPNVIRVFDAFKTHTYLFTFMELCPGGSIERKIYPDANDTSKRTPIPMNQAVTWFCQVASGIEYIHSKSYAHRDIKPDNIFVSAEDVAKLADFGFVTRIRNETGQVLSTTACGSAEYMSPEIYSGKYDASQADVWALGITFFEMFTARLLFNDMDKQKCLENKKKGDLNFPHGIAPAVVQKVVKRMLHPNPATRITSADLIKYIDQHLITIF